MSRRRARGGEPRRTGSEPSKWAPNEDGSLDRPPVLPDSSGTGGTDVPPGPYPSTFSPDQGWFAPPLGSGSGEAKAVETGDGEPRPTGAGQKAATEAKRGGNPPRARERGATGVRSGLDDMRVGEPRWVEASTLVHLGDDFYAGRDDGGAWRLYGAKRVSVRLVGEAKARKSSGGLLVARAIADLVVAVVIIGWGTFVVNGDDSWDFQMRRVVVALVVTIAMQVLTTSTWRRRLEVADLGALDAAFEDSARSKVCAAAIMRGLGYAACAAGWVGSMAVPSSAGGVMLTAAFALTLPACIVFLRNAPIVASFLARRSIESGEASEPSREGEGDEMMSLVWEYEGFDVAQPKTPERILVSGARWNDGPRVGILVPSRSGSALAEVLDIVEFSGLWILGVVGLCHYFGLFADDEVAGFALAALMVAAPIAAIVAMRTVLARRVVVSQESTRGHLKTIRNVRGTTDEEELGSAASIAVSVAVVLATGIPGTISDSSFAFWLTVGGAAGLCMFPWAIRVLLHRIHRREFLREAATSK